MKLMRNTFSLFNLQISRELLLREVFSLLRDHQYEEDTGFGFTQTALEDEYIEAILIKRTPILIPSFVNNQISKKEIFIYSEVPFAIDFSNLFLEIHDSVKQVSKVIQVLRKVFDGRITISDCTLFPSILIPEFKEQTDSLIIQNLIINNFKYDNTLIGRYSFSVLNTNRALKLLDEYGHDVTKAIIQIENKDFEYSLEFHSAGRVTIKCEEVRFKEIFFFLKRLLNNQNNG